MYHLAMLEIPWKFMSCSATAASIQRTRMENESLSKDNDLQIYLGNCESLNQKLVALVREMLQNDPTTRPDNTIIERELQTFKETTMTPQRTLDDIVEVYNQGKPIHFVYVANGNIQFKPSCLLLQKGTQL